MEEQNKKKISQMIKEIGMDKLLIIAICGVVLVILSIPTEKKDTVQKKASVNLELQPQNQADYTQELEERLKTFLQNIKGVGSVEVMITLEHTGEETALFEQPYSKNSRNRQEQDGSQEVEEAYDYQETVVLKRESNGAEVPYIISVKQPEIRGIAIVCQGGENPELVMKITSLIEALFHISAHKISVIGMK